MSEYGRGEYGEGHYGIGVDNLLEAFGLGLYGLGSYGIGDITGPPPSTYGIGVYGAGVYGIGGATAEPDPPPPEKDAEVQPVAPAGGGFWTGALSYGGMVRNFGVIDAITECAWIWRGIDGWDSPPVSGSVQQRAGDHGGWAGPQFWAPRPLTLRVSVDAPTQLARDRAREQLQRILPVSDLAVLRYDEPTASKRVLVRRSGTLTESCVNLVSCDFTIGLVAPDPRKYSEALHTVTVAAAAAVTGGLTPPLIPPLTLAAQQATSSTDLVNAGNMETRPTVRIIGPIASPSIANLRTGRQVTYESLRLSSTDELVVNMDTRQGFLNGAFRSADPLSAWWSLEPGENTVQLGGSSNGTARMIIEWRDAWI
ncbi:phage distal tail protein [Parafrankia discariae]|uniref:phage distal tail protein n=1 Tax=Parafrankia discariae TaxID=365528 RepID=UPI00037F619C|nr:phage tail domain-containing protein [Parafrankia discariae]